MYKENLMFFTKIREMQKRDIPDIMEIESVSFGEIFWQPEAFMQEIESELGNYFTAEDEKGKIVGYCGFWLILDEGHITTIATHPDYRKKGLGERLLQKIIETGYEKNAKWFTLEVRASNIPAQNMYYKYNFKSLGLRKNYYQDNNEDALVMWTENIWNPDFRKVFEGLKNEKQSH